MPSPSQDSETLTDAREVPWQPTESMWGGLARDIMMWLDMSGPSEKTPGALFTHLERLGRAIPQWLRDEPEMKDLNHVPSKGTRVAIIYKAMLADAPPRTPSVPGEDMRVAVRKYYLARNYPDTLHEMGLDEATALANHFAALAREEAAKIAESWNDGGVAMMGQWETKREIAAAIRAIGKEG